MALTMKNLKEVQAVMPGVTAAATRTTTRARVRKRRRGFANQCGMGNFGQKHVANYGLVL